MKTLLTLIIFLISTLAYSETVTITLENNQTLKCKPEISITGYFCKKGEQFLILKSFSGGYSSVGRVGKDKKIKSYTVTTIKSNRGKILFKQPALPFKGNWSNVNPQPLPKTLSRKYGYLETAISMLSAQNFNEGATKIVPSKEYTELLKKELQILQNKKDQLNKQINSNTFIVTLNNNKKVKCKRGKTKKKDKDTIKREQTYDTKENCGVFSCGKDKQGNIITLFSHHNITQNVNDIVYLSKDGFINGPKIKSIALPNIKQPIYDYSQDTPFAPLYSKKPEIKPNQYIPQSLKNQSDYFLKTNTINYQATMNDIGRLCKKKALQNFKKSRKAYNEKLQNAQLVQYITIANKRLASNLIPQINLPKYACRIDGVFYNPQAYKKAKYFQDRQAKKAITYKRAQELFNYAKSMKDIAWNYKEDGCYARAHLMAKRFKAQGIQVDKAWLKGELQLKPQKGSLIQWGFHVAPVVYIKNKKEQIEKYIIDPSTFDNPVPVKVWAKKLDANKNEPTATRFPFPENSDTFKRTSLAFSNDKPYLPNDPLKRTEQENMKLAKKTMATYLKFGVKQ
jgi:hypothetical protein